MTSFCENCGSRNIAQMETQIPGILADLKYCGCCGVITKIKREVIIDSP